MPKVVVKLFAGQGTGDYMFPPLGSLIIHDSVPN